MCCYTFSRGSADTMQYIQINWSFFNWLCVTVWKMITFWCNLWIFESFFFSCFRSPVRISEILWPTSLCPCGWLTFEGCSMASVSQYNKHDILPYISFLFMKKLSVHVTNDIAKAIYPIFPNQHHALIFIAIVVLLHQM